MQNIARKHIENQVHEAYQGHEPITPSRDTNLTFIKAALQGQMSTNQAVQMAPIDRENARHYARGTFEFLMERIGAGGPTIAWGATYPVETQSQLGQRTRIPRAATPDEVTHAPANFVPKQIVDSNTYRI